MTTKRKAGFNTKAKAPVPEQYPHFVIGYDEASPELKAAMEKRMVQLDKTRGNVLAIRDYGAQPFSALGRAVGNLDATGPGKDIYRQVLAEAIEEFDIHLGGATEVLRRFNQNYIPEAAEAYVKNQNLENQRYLRDVLECKEYFLEHITIMEGSRAASVVHWQQLGAGVSVLSEALFGKADTKAKPAAKP